MALIREFADFLVAARRQGAAFTATVTLGRQQNYLACDKGLRTRSSRVVTDPFIDTFCRQVLAVETLDALDYSGYQGANLVHDLNQPLPPHLEARYDAVIDGGTLEHVFDFPMALRNAMRLAKPGGALFLCTPANNLFGHGFYQFSPDLFYRVLGPQNGYRLDKMALVESYFPGVERGMRQKRYAVKDPAETGGRSDMVSRFPSLLLVQATRTGAVPDALRALQSDYVATWNQSGRAAGTAAGREAAAPVFKRLLRSLLAGIPARWEHALRSRYEAWRFYNPATHPCFAKAPPAFFAVDWTEHLDG